jgi:hypothetical protein
MIKPTDGLLTGHQRDRNLAADDTCEFLVVKQQFAVAQYLGYLRSADFQDVNDHKVMDTGGRPSQPGATADGTSLAV